MKAKTRLLAMLLTLLMVAGMLPLSLFALDEPLGISENVGGKYENRSLDDIKAEFAKTGMTLARYQTFELLTNETFKSLYNSYGHAILGYASNTESGKPMVDTRAYCDYNDDDGDRFNIVDQKLSGLSIVTEANGNKALYFGTPANDDKQNAENYISATGFDHNGERFQDVMISIDLKMNGDVIAVPSTSIINFVYRAGNLNEDGSKGREYPYFVGTVQTTEDGTLYIGDKKNTVGKLSKTEYTRIAVATDRLNNKFYVYINDVLVNAGGSVLFSDSAVAFYNNYHGTSYTASTIHLSDVRIYVVGGANGANSAHQGLYVDNLLVGKRWAVSERDNSNTVIINSNFSGATPGANVYPTSEAAFGTGYNKMGGDVSGAAALVYVDEDGDGKVDAMKYQTLNASDKQAFVSVSIGNDKNLSFSFDIKLGETGEIKGSDNLIYHDINRGGDETRVQRSIVSISNKGVLKLFGAEVGTVTKDAYTNVRLEIITNGVEKKATYYLLYVDGVLKRTAFTYDIRDDYLYIRTLRFYAQYKGALNSLKADDLHVKNLKLSYSNEFNHTNAYPFAKNPTGFFTFGGVTRYYDGQGGYKTTDFFVGSTKYLVGKDGEIVSKISGQLATRTLDDIKAEFAKQGLDLRLYQSYENTGLLTDGATEYTYPKSTNANVAMPGSFDYAAGAYVNYKNYRPSFTLKTEADGNKALLINHSAKEDTGNDNYFDILSGLAVTDNGVNGNGANDYFISMDFKMGGDNIIATALINLIYRPESGGGQTIPLIHVSQNGGLYIGTIGEDSADRNYSPENLVGFLSKDEYTRIAIATDKLNNKYYVYINDVLVNPDGETLIKKYVLDKMNEKLDNSEDKYNYKNVPFSEIRVYSTSAHDDFKNHKGLYFDNIILGTRQPFADITTPNNYKEINIGSVDTGVTLDANGAGGKFDITKFVNGQTSNGTWSSGGAVVRYVDENGDGRPDAVEWNHPKDATLVSGSGEAYFNINRFANKGDNISVSISIKGGQTGNSSTNNLIGIRSNKVNGSTRDVYDVNVKLASDGTLKANVYTASDVVIGKITSTKYTEVRVDIVCNTTMPTAFFYVDGELKAQIAFPICYSDAKTGASGGYSSTDYHPSIVRIASIYTGSVPNINEQDFRIRSFGYGKTNAYDNGTERISVFENKLSGLHGIGGVTRYYNGDSTYKTDDFTADGVSYVVSGKGIATRLDRQVAPYAPYVDWAHSGTLIVNSNDGKVLNGGSGSDNVRTGYNNDRDAYYQYATLANGDKAVLLTSYRDSDRSQTDFNSYASIDFNKDTQSRNTQIVIDMDIMLDEVLVEYSNIAQDLFYFCGYDSIENWGGGLSGGHRKDTKALRLDPDGWIVDNDGTTRLFKLSNTEFTRLSLAVQMPVVDENENLVTPMSIGVYANGVLIKTITASSSVKCVIELRYLQVNDADFSAYVKDIYAYAGAKPQQFYTMVNGSPVLTSDQSKTPAKASDIKSGFVAENSTVRYYNELGLPVVSNSVTVGDKTYTADRFGVIPVPCVGNDHVGNTDKGECSICGTKFDGVSSLYGNSLILGSDVKVVYYLDLDAAKVKGVELGLDRDYTYGTTEKIDLADLETVTIGGKTYYKVFYAVSGKDVYADVTVKVIKADGSEGTSYVYSASKYAEDVQKLETTAVYTEQLKALASALLVYGKNAAAVLSDGEAAETITGVDFSGVTAAGTADKDSVISLNKISLELKSNIKIRLYFNVDLVDLAAKGRQIADYVATVSGKAVDYAKVDELCTETVDVYVIDCEVVAKDLATSFVFNIGVGEGEAFSGLSATFSALYYAKTVVASNKSTESEKNLAKAVKLYADAAAAYANEIAEDNRPAV